MLNCSQFRSLIINPVLSKLQVYSKDAEELLVFTCATESDGGHYIHQVGGQALGIYQMEPNTHTDIWVNFIRNNNRLATLMTIHFGCNKVPDPDRLIYDLAYATAMARIHYMRVSVDLPDASDSQALWEYYKEHYNTFNGKAEKLDSLNKYKAFSNPNLP